MKQKILDWLDQLIQDGEELLKTATNVNGVIGLGPCVNSQKCCGWKASCEHLVNSICGQNKDTWKIYMFGEKMRARHNSNIYDAQGVIGVLQALRQEVDSGRLSFYNLVFAEVFSDILEQAHHLYLNKYFIAACVLGRCVLESHLRKMCVKHACVPVRSRSTIEDYKSSLYKGGFIDKVQMKQIESLAALGNNAAHGNQVSQQDAKQMIDGVTCFLSCVI